VLMLGVPVVPQAFSLTNQVQQVSALEQQIPPPDQKRPAPQIEINRQRLGHAPDRQQPENNGSATEGDGERHSRMRCGPGALPAPEARGLCGRRTKSAAGNGIRARR
jgi:hypothetical protein